MMDKLLPPAGTDLLCKNLISTRFEDLSEENVDLFRDRLLDMTGCLFGGAIVPEDRFLEGVLRRWGGSEEAPLFARSGRLPLPAAALLNCITARANDFGNMYFHVLGDRIASHCGETLIPLGLTLADVFGVSGREFIASNIAAEDMTARILYTLPSRWPTDMLMVSSAAAALASRYYGFDPAQAKAALSYAATNATDPANSYYDYSQEFKYHNGAAAQAAVMACELVKGGWKGLEDPFFGHWGLISMHSNGELPGNYETAFADLGKVWYTEESFKRNPGGIPTTPAAECGAKIRGLIIEKYGKLDPDKIKSVRVSRSRAMPKNYYANPLLAGEHTNALFSFQFMACCALLKGEISVADVQTEAIRNDTHLMRLALGVPCGEYVNADGIAAIKAEAEMYDGTVFTVEKDAMKTRFSHPGKEFIERKFRSQFSAFGKLPECRCSQIIEMAGRIETLGDMREYTELLVL